MYVKRTLKPIALALSLLSLGACQHTNVGEPSLGDTIARNSVQMVRLPFEVMIEEDGTASLSNVSKTAINNFLTSSEVTYADVLMLDGPTASPNRIAAIESYIRETGLVYAGTSVLGAEPQNGAVMLYIERYVVTTPRCGEWLPEYSNNSRNNDSPFYGCANTANLGLMVANPRDLISGQSAGNTTAAAVGAIYTPSPKEKGPSMTLSMEGLTAPTTAPSTGNR